MKVVSKVEFKEKVAGALKIAQKEKADLVVYIKGGEEEFLIRSVKDIDEISIKSGDIIDVTVYDKDDDDLFFEEYQVVRSEKIKTGKTDHKDTLATHNHFSQFMKKK